MNEMLEALSAPFPPERISWRVGSTTKDKSKGMALAYVDARDVMFRLDEVCGPENWRNDYLPMPNGTTCCRIEIKIDGEWVGKSNGAGETKVEGDKGAYSDAFKRAAVLWGIGRYLYDIKSPWVQLDVNNGYVRGIKPAEIDRLKSLLPGAPAAKPRDQRRDDYANLNISLKNCRTHEQIDVLLDEFAQLIADMPTGWRPTWDENVASMRRALAQHQEAAE